MVDFESEGPAGLQIAWEGKMNAVPTNTETASQTNGCACGCGREIGKRSTFAPGHDAKMVSNLVEFVVGHGNSSASVELLVAPALSTEPSLNGGEGYMDLDIQNRIDLAQAAVNHTFGGALAVKFVNAAHTAWEKYDKSNGRKLKSDGARSALKDKSPKASPVARRSPAADQGQVKVGRWFYDAKRFDGGEVVYVNKQGADVIADAKVAATFGHK